MLLIQETILIARLSESKPEAPVWEADGNIRKASI